MLPGVHQAEEWVDERFDRRRHSAAFPARAIAAPDQRIGPGDELSFQVASNYLFGPPAGGLAAETRVRLEPQTGAVDAKELPVKAGDSGALPAGASPEGKTTFVETANSFLDIFCVDEEETRGGDPKEGEEAVEETEKDDDEEKPANPFANTELDD